MKSSEEKTELATPKQKREARDKGRHRQDGKQGPGSRAYAHATVEPVFFPA